VIGYLDRVEVVWVFLPLVGAFITHAPVLSFDLFRTLARPIDGGATIRGHRVFGANKTWRGAIIMTAGVVAFAGVLAQFPAYWSQLPSKIQHAGPLIFGLLLGLGVVIGELPNSFLKRQLNIQPGSQRFSIVGAFFIVLDQGDFVLGAWLLLAPIWLMPPHEALLAFLLVVAAHMVINVLGFAIGARKTWL
jgi:hypothetical protein